MHIDINEETLWLLIIVTLFLTLILIVIYRLFKWLGRRCTNVLCRSLRVKRIHKINLLERLHGFGMSVTEIRPRQSIQKQPGYFLEQLLDLPEILWCVDGVTERIT